MEKISREEYKKMTKEEKLLYWAKIHRTKTEQDVGPAAKALANAFKSEENIERTRSILWGMTDGKPVNKNPLKKVPKVKMRLYGIFGVFDSKFFDSFEDLNKWEKDNDKSFGSECMLEYLGRVADCDDVIRVIFKDGKSFFYTVVDADGYGIYNEERSIYRGEFVWEYYHGDISAIYDAFRDRGIVFENDIYKNIEEKNRNNLKMCKEKKLKISKN